MTCRHSAGDPDCSANRITRTISSQPDSEKYEILNAHQVNSYMILEVLYPNCAKCSYEGRKVLVFENVRWQEVLRWKKIDPHFRAPSKMNPKEAPAPIARFPATEQGMFDALAFVDLRVKQNLDKQEEGMKTI